MCSWCFLFALLVLLVLPELLVLLVFLVPATELLSAAS